MDGIPTSSLPGMPPPGAPQVNAFVPGMPPPGGAPAAARPPGRPSGDPEAQARRAEQHERKKKLESILPSEMTDGKIAIFKLVGRRGRTKKTNNPCLIIPFSELEKAYNDGNTNTGDYVKQRLIQKFGEGCPDRFLWLAQDNRGRALLEYGEAEVSLTDDNYEDDETDREDDDEDDDRDDRRFDSRRAPPPPVGMPNAFDPAAHAKTIKDVMQDQNKNSQDMMGMMMAMMQNSSQMMMAMMQQQQQQAEARRYEEERRREREEEKERARAEREREREREERREREKEEDRRREREAEARRQDAQLQQQLFTAMMNRPDTMTPMLIKLIESKGDRDGMKDLFSMMSEASKQSMSAQGEATKQLLVTQAEAAKQMIGNVMGISQQVVASMLEAQSDDGNDDPMSKIAKLFAVLKPALSQVMGGSAQAAAAALPAPQPVPAVQQAPAQPQQPQRPSDKEFVKGCLYTVMRLETGEIPSAQRPDALVWIAKNAPPALRAAIQSKDAEQIMAAGAEGLDDRLLAWITDEAHQAFMQRCVEDVHLMLTGAFDQTAAKASMEAHAKYHQEKSSPKSAEVVDAAPAALAAAPAASSGPVRRAPPPGTEMAEAAEETPQAP